MTQTHCKGEHSNTLQKLTFKHITQGMIQAHYKR